MSKPPRCRVFTSCSTSRSASYDAIARFETMWHSFFHRVSWSAMLRGRHCGGVAAGLPWKRVRLVRRAQHAGEGLGDVAAHEGLAQELGHTRGARTLRELRAAVAAHQHDPQLGAYAPHLARELHAVQVRHGLV